MFISESGLYSILGCIVKSPARDFNKSMCSIRGLSSGKIKIMADHLKGHDLQSVTEM